MEELFTGVFKALIALGGGGWIVSGLFLLGVVYLYRENNKIRDRAEAIGERTILGMERVATSTATMAATLDQGTRSSEEVIRLLTGIARRSESDSLTSHQDLAEILKAQRDMLEDIRAASRENARVFAEHKEIIDGIRANHMELVRIGGRGSQSPQSGS